MKIRVISLDVAIFELFIFIELQIFLPIKIVKIAFIELFLFFFCSANKQINENAFLCFQ
jgi:hypothetical protein